MPSIIDDVVEVIVIMVVFPLPAVLCYLLTRVIVS
jgi:hypothetical protein